MASETPSEANAAQDKGGLPPRWVLKTVTRMHVALHRLSGGRFFNTLTGDDVCFVTMTGAKSGRRLTVPLMYVPHSGGVLLVASQGGAPKNPVWYNNLIQHPDIEVNHRGRPMTLKARLAKGEEKTALWPLCDQHYAPYADYRARTTRDIPLFICEPA
jgi:deazaflavin-dependent oxidoreductase (nitroreductase family)